jgi:hypothetical protein
LKKCSIVAANCSFARWLITIDHLFQLSSILKLVNAICELLVSDENLGDAAKMICILSVQILVQKMMQDVNISALLLCNG